MTNPFDVSFPRYLAAKRTVDDRALYRPAWEALRRALALTSGPLHVLEVGAGIGTMIERALEWDLFGERAVVYTAIDEQAENIAAAGARLLQWAAAHGWQAQPAPAGLLLERGAARLEARLQAAELFDWIGRVEAGAAPRPGLLIAHAFLDLLNLPASLPRIFDLLDPGGWFYFTINFDGATLLEPQVDAAFDELVQLVYHRTMDERVTDGRPSGDSRAGRHLFDLIPRAGGEILSAGTSDWVVYPQGGAYPADEAYFLHFIIHTMHTALRLRPEIEPRRLEAWAARRRAQVEAGELTYIAHQLDFFGKRV
jgi:SAM-dependent methyltransferase